MKNKLWTLMCIFALLISCHKEQPPCPVDLAFNLILSPNLVSAFTSTILRLKIYNANNEDCKIITIPETSAMLQVKKLNEINHEYELNLETSLIIKSFQSNEIFEDSIDIVFTE